MRVSTWGATGLFGTPAETAQQAITHAVDLIGVSSLAGAHGELTAQLLHALSERGVSIPVVLGGNVQGDSERVLSALGVAGFFLPGTRMDEIVRSLVTIIGRGGSEHSTLVCSALEPNTPEQPYEAEDASEQTVA